MLLWLWALLLTSPFVRVAVIGDINGLVVGAASLAVVLIAGVLLGSRTAWSIALAFQVAVVLPIGDVHLSALALNLVALGCLISPDARHFALQNKRQEAASRRSSSEPAPKASALR